MTRTLTTTCLLLAALGSFLAGAPAARADDYETVAIDRETGRSDAFRVRARVLATPAGSRQGGYGYARVELINPTAKGHTVGIQLGTTSRPGRTCSYRRSARVEAESRVVLEVPLINAAWGIYIQFTLDGRPSQGSVHARGAASNGASLAALAVGRTRADGSLKAWLEGEAKRIARGGRAWVEFRVRGAAELPQQWTLLSGFDVVFVDQRTAELTPERQRVLMRYLAAGGHLVLMGAPHAAEGPLAALLAPGPGVASPPAQGHHGLGRWIAIEDPSSVTSSRVQGWMEHGRRDGLGVFARLDRAQAGAVPPPFWMPLEIPGLGDVPTGLFFLLILAFAILVGPVSYIILRRKRKLVLLLLTVPAAGFLCTLFILAYGLFSEGFGIVGSQRSLSVLDQASREAVTFTGRTLYAGLQPRALEPRAGTFAYCATYTTHNRYGDMDGHLSVDLDAGHRIAGGILPSRTPTPFVTSSVGRARARLRFRRRDDGGFDVLAAPGFTPLDEPGAVLLHTPAGGWYVLGPAGHLAPVGQASTAVAKAWEGAIGPASEMPVGSGEIVERAYWGAQKRYYSRSHMQTLAQSSVSIARWSRGRFASLPKGSYVARMRVPALTDELGLDVEYRSEEHVVLGLLGEEDVLDE